MLGTTVNRAGYLAFGPLVKIHVSEQLDQAWPHLRGLVRPVRWAPAGRPRDGRPNATQ
jgi:hypothetical protein